MGNFLTDFANAAKKKAQTFEQSFSAPRPAAPPAPAAPQFSQVAQQRILARSPAQGAVQLAAGPHMPSITPLPHFNPITAIPGAFRDAVGSLSAPVVNTAQVPFSAGRVVAANLTHNQPALNNAHKALASDTSNNMLWNDAFRQTSNELAGAIASRNYMNKTNAANDKLGQTIAAAYGNSPRAKLYGDLVASSGKNQDINRYLNNVGIDQNTSKGMTALKLGAPIASAGAQTALNMTGAGKGAAIAADVAAKQAAKLTAEQAAKKATSDLLKTSLKYGTTNAGISMLSPASQGSTNAMDYVKAGASGFAGGAAMPILGAGLTKGGVPILKAAGNLTNERIGAAKDNIALQSGITSQNHQLAKEIASHQKQQADLPIGTDAGQRAHEVLQRKIDTKTAQIAQNEARRPQQNILQKATDRVLTAQPGMSMKAVTTDATPAEVLPHEAVPQPAPEATGTGGVSLPKNTPNVAESRFPLRVMTDPRTDPIMPTLDKLATHDVKHNADVLTNTGAKIAQNEDAALAFAKRGNSTEANATAMQLLEKYLSEGSHEKASELLQSVGPRFTRQGQETQILAAYSKTATPAGAVRYATKEVEKAAGKSANGAKLEDKTAQVHTAVQQTAKEVAHQLSEEVKASKIATASAPKTGKTPEEMLANRIKAPSDKKFSTQDPVKDMVATLHKVAKQVIPDAEKKLPRDPMALVGQAIKGKEEYAGVYDKAKALVLDKYKDNPQALAELEKYFGTDATRTYAESQLKTGMQQGLKGTNLSKIVKEHYSKVNETGQELKQKLIERAGLSESEATQLSGDIQKRYDQLIAEKKDAVIKQIFGDKPKPEQVQLADRILQYHNLGAMGRDELRPLVAKKLGLETLSPEASKTISNMAAHIQTLADGSSERLQATADMMRFIAQQKPQSGLDNAVGIYKAGMLSGPKTQEGNALSNGVFAGLKKVSDVPASIADRGFALAGKTQLGKRVGLTGDRTIGLTARGGISGTQTGFSKGMSVMRGKPEFTAGDKYEQHAEINLKNPILQKVFGTPSNYVFRGMQAADQPFRYAALKNSLYDQAYAAGRNEGLTGSALKSRAEQLVQNPTEQMAATAAKESKKSVLDYDTYASRAIQAAHQGIDKMVENGGSPLGGKIANGALNVLAPFVRVPSAFLSRTVDFTPLGIGKEVGHQLFTKTFNQRALSQAIGEGLTGTGIIALGMHLSGQGQLSGDYPKNNQKEQQRWKTEGIQPNSIKIGKQWKSLNYLGPVGLLFGVGKKIDEAKGSGNTEKVGQAVLGLGRGLLGQSFLQGLNGFSTAVQDPTKVGSYLNSEASSIIPAWVNDIGNATDTFQRQANTVADAVKGRLPGIRHGLNPKQDVYGNNLPNQASGLNAINGLKPSNDLTINNPVTSEVSRLHSVDPNNSDLQVTPTPITSITLPAAQKGAKSTIIKLNSQQKYDVQKQVGQSIQSNWDKIIKSPAYQNDSDTGKAKRLSQARQDTTELATRKYVTDNNLGTYSKPASKSAVALASGNTSKYTSATGGSAGGGVTVNDTIDAHSQKVLNEYNTLDAATRKSKAYKENDYDYKVAQAKYDNAKANGSLTRVQDINQKQAVTKAKIGSAFSKDIRETYDGLDKSEVYNLITTDPNGKQIASDLLAYGDALANATGSQNKFRTSKGVEAFAPKPKGSSGRSGYAAQKALLAAFKTPYSDLVKSRTKGASLARSATLGKKRA